jgi:HEAT repeat protein
LEQQVREALRPLQNDDNCRVRAAATLVLARLGDANAVEWIPRLLTQRDNRLGIEDEEQAIELAGQLRIQSAKAALEKRAWPWLWESSTSWKAQVALAQLGDERARHAVLQNLHARSPAKCARAVEAAGRIGLEEARPRLLALLQNPSVHDVDAIRTALKRLGPSS